LTILLSFTWSRSFEVSVAAEAPGVASSASTAATKIQLSLVLPVLVIAGLVACGVTDACFH
jgi:hypothetical protein